MWKATGASCVSVYTMSLLCRGAGRLRISSATALRTLQNKRGWVVHSDGQCDVGSAWQADKPDIMNMPALRGEAEAGKRACLVDHNSSGLHHWALTTTTLECITGQQYLNVLGQLLDLGVLLVHDVLEKVLLGVPLCARSRTSVCHHQRWTRAGIATHTAWQSQPVPRKQLQSTRLAH